MKNILKTYQKRLTNLSGRNKSLLLLRKTKGNFEDLKDYDFLHKKTAYSIISALIGRKATKIPLCALADSRDEKANRGSRALRALQRTAQFVYEEQGSRELYVGYPWVYGKLMNDAPVRCPLLFFPVRLKSESNCWYLCPDANQEINFNKTLLLACAHFNGINFEDHFLDTNFSEFPTDDQDFRTALYHLLEKSPLEIHFNQQTFEDHLRPFIRFTRKEYEQATETGRLKIHPEAVLGIFPQADSYLFPDYEQLIRQQTAHSLEDFFLPDIKLTAKISRNRQEESLTTPYLLDAAQEKAIMSVKNGGSIVVQGPPGSGKSQMICNLIADGLANGKNILLVSQKKAALDVVYARLSEKKLDDFTALIHDFKGDRKETYQKINRQIESLQGFISKNNSLDTVNLERRFLQISREIAQITEELAEFRAALYDQADAGISAKALYLNAQIKAPQVKLRREYAHFPHTHQQRFATTLGYYLPYARRFDVADYPWFERLSFASLKTEAQENIRETLCDVAPFFNRIATQINQIIAMKIDLDEADWLLKKEDDFRKFLAILEDEKVFKYFKESLKFGNTDSLWLSSRKQNLLNAFGAEGVEKSLERKAIGTFTEKVMRALNAQKKWFKRLKWQLFSKDKAKIATVIAANGLADQPKPLELLIQRLENRMNLEHNLTKLNGYLWLIDRPQVLEKNDFEVWINRHISALKAKDLFTALRNGVKYLEIEQLSFDELFKKIDFVLALAKKIPKRRKKWEEYLSPPQIRKLIGGTLTAEAMSDALDKDFDALCEFDKLKQKCSPEELNLIAKLKDAQQDFDTQKTLQLFNNSLQNAWIHHLEAKHPVLRIVSSARIFNLESRLEALIEEKQALCKEIVLLHARERTYKSVKYNRLDNMVTYRDLKHQVNKKRQIWPLRKLIAHFSHELLDLLPCWMASPESVSAIFPLEELFDLVIFDEASQCFAEKGIPAMFRGKQVVIAGDSQQLAPYDLYRPRWEGEQDDNDNDPALEVNSLLDLGVRYIPQHRLNGHYRSKFPALIHFSNQTFYDGNLRMIPDFRDFKQDEPAITYIKVEDGTRLNRVNEKEAKRIAALVATLLAEGQQNIGVITFNFPQQERIRDLLEEEKIPLPSTFFVKNIENVQGDERDIIIFSIGYAPGKDGKMRVNFGSLNTQNGENRLNVAITRARTKIYVVSSIFPHQLAVENTLNQGPKLLKAYLQYAHDVSEGKINTFLPKHNAQKNDAMLSEALKKLNNTPENLIADVPFADLSVEIDGKRSPQLILTDDAAYYYSISPKDAHAYMPMLLKQKGWQVERFFSRQLWKQKEMLAETLNRLIGTQTAQSSENS